MINAELLVPLNTVAPYYIEFKISSTDDSEAVGDLSLVTTAFFRVRKPEQTNETSATFQDWTTSIQSQTSTLLVLRHVFAAGDVNKVGRYRVEPRLQTPAGELIASIREFVVKEDEFNIPPDAGLPPDPPPDGPTRMTRGNKRMAAQTTAGDGDQAVGVGVGITPHNDGYVQVFINTTKVQVGDGVKNAPCYFSGDGGTTARAIADIAIGDTLHWQGTNAGYQLATTDTVSFDFQET